MPERMKIELNHGNRDRDKACEQSRSRECHGSRAIYNRAVVLASAVVRADIRVVASYELPV